MPQTLEQKYKEEEEPNIYENTMEFFGKLVFLPGLKEHPEFDKNITTTNLRSRYYEPEKARILLKALHILQHYMVLHKKKDVLVDYQEVHSNGKIIKIPVYEERDIYLPKYPKTFKMFLNQIQSLIITSKARDGFALREFGKKRIERTESIEDKTEAPSGWIPFTKKNKGSRRDDYGY